MTNDHLKVQLTYRQWPYLVNVTGKADQVLTLLLAIDQSVRVRSGHLNVTGGRSH
jgi:hypothetical protein